MFSNVNLILVSSLLGFVALISATPTPVLAVDAQEEKREVHVLAGAPINSLVLDLEPESLTQCSNVSLSWGQGDAGSAPYRIQIGTGGYYANLTWLYEYTNITSTNFTWPVPGPEGSNITAGDTLVFQLWDSTNTTTYSQNHIVQGGGNLTANGTCPYSSSNVNYSTPVNVSSDAAASDGSDGDDGENSPIAQLIAEFEKTLASTS
ncbi:hypothetical protein IAU59_005969 [Kwoniella sp. CBS 9459]